jgi:drug/metabolite transporter (DMT)-like permease
VDLSLKSWIKFIFLGFAWGSSFLWIKIALGEVNPFTLVFFRVLIATIGLVFFFLFTRRKFSLKWWWIYAVIGFFNVAFPFALISWSEKFISSGLAAILNSTVPLFTMLIASFFVREDKLTPARIAGLLVGFSGVLVLMANRVDSAVKNQTLGIVAMLVAACCYGASAVFARRTNQYVTPEDQSLGQMAAGVILIAPAMLIWESPFHLPTLPPTIFALSWLGLIGSFVAALLWFGMINEIGPSKSSMVTYMFPLVGVILGVLILHETVDWHLYAGGALILAGIFLVNSKRFSIKNSDQSREVITGSQE